MTKFRVFIGWSWIYPPPLMKHRASFPHKMDARDEHNGQRDKRRSVRLSIRWSFTLTTHCVKKERHPAHVDNFAKYWRIFKIISLLDSAHNLLQYDNYTSIHTLKMLLHYLVKLAFQKSHKFENTVLVFMN